MTCMDTVEKYHTNRSAQPHAPQRLMLLAHSHTSWNMLLSCDGASLTANNSGQLDRPQISRVLSPGTSSWPRLPGSVDNVALFAT